MLNATPGFEGGGGGGGGGGDVPEKPSGPGEAVARVVVVSGKVGVRDAVRLLGSIL
jgi:hypothetical protein